MPDIGLLIRELRIAKNITQKELVAQLSESCNLSRIENNKTRLSFSLFIEIIMLLDITWEDLRIHAPLLLQQEPLHYYNIQQAFDTHNVLLSRNKIQIYRAKLKRTIQTLSPEDLKRKNAILLYHRISCFYCLNFEHNFQQGKKHSFILLKHYQYQVTSPLHKEFELIPLLIPFVPEKIIATLFNDIRFALRRYDKTEFLFDIYIRATFNYVKRLIIEQRYTDLPLLLIELESFLANNTNIPFLCELYIIKGIHFYEVEHNHVRGTQLIHQGLALANECHYNTLYQNWLQYCQKYF